MSAPRVRQKRPNKPPACDSCKAKRVLCHPQPNGQPCPRCAEKKTICITTPVSRGRARFDPALIADKAEPAELTMAQQFPPALPLSVAILPPAGGCPDLTPELVRHFFDCFSVLNLTANPLLEMSSIKTNLEAASFQLSLLAPQTRVLSLCIMAIASLVSFHEVVLGPGPRPTSCNDLSFFAAGLPADVRGCGKRRAPICRALHGAALKAAWDTGIILQVSVENAASAFLLDILDHTDSFTPSRPWAGAYISHVRALAPVWRAGNPIILDVRQWEATTTPPYSGQWTAFLMAEALISTRDRKPILITLEDQLLLYGVDPPSAEEALSKIEAATKKPDATALFDTAKAYMFHITRLARQLWSTITSDHARTKPLSESAVLQFLSALSIIHAILSHMLAHADALLAATPPLSAQDHHGLSGLVHGLFMGFTSLALPVYLELVEFRGREAQPADEHARGRLRLLEAQARSMTAQAVHELACSMRYLPNVLYSPLLRLVGYAQFALDEAEAAPVRDPERVEDLATIANHLSIVAYSHDLTGLPELALLERLDRYLQSPVVQPQSSELSGFTGMDTGMLEDLLFPLDQAWMGMDLLRGPDGLDGGLV
ncbi:hypothetical protein C8R46DRAFT_1303519 [Mycena filopes]|nr:hypothetical protein C8R46DRAFT_1303519 [Mycena filopes]